jgi:hypothetical protein
MKKIFLFILCILLVLSTVEITAEVKIPHEFKSGEVAKASEVNANFNTLKEAIELLQKRIAELEEENRDLKKRLYELEGTLEKGISFLKTPLKETLPETPTVIPQPMKTSLRSKPLTVSEEEFKEVFKLDENRQPREYIQNDYENLGDVIIDHATGLMWQKSGSDEQLTYQQAQAYVEKLNRERFAGYDDWRLPTVDELISLLEPEKQLNDLYINPIFDATQRFCWSVDRSSSGAAWGVHFGGGDVFSHLVKLLSYVRCVRF